MILRSNPLFNKQSRIGNLALVHDIDEAFSRMGHDGIIEPFDAMYTVKEYQLTPATDTHVSTHSLF